MASPMLHIRKNVLGMTQVQLAALTGAQQGTVSRWERGQLEPSRDQLERIREEARNRGVEWDDSWFFERPDCEAAA